MLIPKDGKAFSAEIAERMKERRGHGTGRQCAKEVGFDKSTWCRMEQGKGCSLHDLVLLLHWLGLTDLRSE